MINRIFISIIIEFRKIIIEILIRELKSKIYHFDKYIIFIFYIKGVLLDNNRVFVKITREIYIIDNFKIRIFIEVNILILE